MDKLFHHMTSLNSLTETSRKTATLLHQSGTTTDIISAHNDLIVVGNMVDVAIIEMREVSEQM